MGDLERGQHDVSKGRTNTGEDSCDNRNFCKYATHMVQGGSSAEHDQLPTPMAKKRALAQIVISKGQCRPAVVQVGLNGPVHLATACVAKKPMVNNYPWYLPLLRGAPTLYVIQRPGQLSLT